MTFKHGDDPAVLDLGEEEEEWEIGHHVDQRAVDLLAPILEKKAQTFQSCHVSMYNWGYRGVNKTFLQQHFVCDGNKVTGKRAVKVVPPGC